MIDAGPPGCTSKTARVGEEVRHLGPRCWSDERFVTKLVAPARDDVCGLDTT